MPVAAGDSNIDRGDLYMGPSEGAGTTGWQYFAAGMIHACQGRTFYRRFDAVAAPASPTGRPTSVTMVRGLRIGLLEDTEAPGWCCCMLGVNLWC